MTGVDFIVDQAGRKKAVIIDLSEHGDWWEDLQVRLADDRREEERALHAAASKAAAALLPVEDFSDWGK